MLYGSRVEFQLSVFSGASPTVSDENGHTALSLASASRHNDVAKILSNASEWFIRLGVIELIMFIPVHVKGTK